MRRRLPCSVRWPARCVSIVSILLFHPFLVVKLQSRWGWQLICNFVDQFNWSWSSYRLALPPERIKDPHVVNWNVSMPTMEICSCWRMLCCDGKFVIKFYALNISSLAYIVEVKQKWTDWLSPVYYAGAVGKVSKGSESSDPWVSHFNNLTPSIKWPAPVTGDLIRRRLDLSQID